MKEKLLNNLGLKILSLFLAFFVWLVVVNRSNPIKSATKEVPLDIINEQVLTAAGRAYEIIGKNTVTVHFDVHTKDEYRVRSTDFRAYVDLAELYDVTGSVPVKVEVLNNKDLVYNEEAKPGVIRVETEELQAKPFDLAVSTVGQAADGYDVGDIILTPTKVTVNGPVSEVGLISYAGVEIDVTGEAANSQGAALPVFYDANGNRLQVSDRITVTPSTIQYDVTISKVRRVPLDFDVTGTAAAGYRYTGVECRIREISVAGAKSTLAGINKITIPSSELDITGATEDKVVTVDLRSYLPEGVWITGMESPMVDILMNVEKLETRTFELKETDIRQENGSADYSYRIEPNRIEVALTGLADDLDALKASDLGASLDLSGLEPGKHTGSLKFLDSEVYTIVSYSDVTVDVAESEPGPGQESETAAAQESAQANSAAETLKETGGSLPE